MIIHEIWKYYAESDYICTVNFLFIFCRLFFLISNFFKHNYLFQYAIKQKINNV